MKFPAHRLAIPALMALCFALATANVAWAEDEAAAFADFQKAVQAANPGTVKQELLQTHVHPPTKPEADEMAATIAHAAIGVMDQAKAFKEHYPNNGQLVAVDRSLMDTLGF